MKNPRVTCLITVYNGESHITESIMSLCAQSMSHIEILVIDDCSSDETVEVVRSIGDSRIRLIESKERLRRARALELGCEEAKGDFIAILDADDYAYPERLEKQVEFFTKNPDYVWLGTAEERVDSQRDEHVIRQYPFDDWGMRKMASKCIPYCHSSVMFRKSLIDQGCNYDPSIPYLIDFELFLRAAQLGKVANLSEVLARRDIRHTSYFQGQFKRNDQNKYLSQLGLKSIKVLNTPFWLALNPLVRLVYPKLPEKLQYVLRKLSGIVERDEHEII